MIYQIIKRGDGTFFPNVICQKTGMSFGAWKGDCKTYDKAYEQLMEYIAKKAEAKINNSTSVVYEVTDNE